MFINNTRWRRKQWSSSIREWRTIFEYGNNENFTTIKTGGIGMAILIIIASDPRNHKGSSTLCQMTLKEHTCEKPPGITSVNFRFIRGIRQGDVPRTLSGITWGKVKETMSITYKNISRPITQHKSRNLCSNWKIFSQNQETTRQPKTYFLRPEFYLA